MTTELNSQIESALEGIIDPHIDRDLVKSKAVKDISAIIELEVAPRRFGAELRRGGRPLCFGNGADGCVLPRFGLARWVAESLESLFPRLS